MEAELLEQLYKAHHGAAYAYCLALCGDHHLASDIVADAFVKAYLSLPDNVPSFRYWLLRVCKNLYFDHLRRRKQETSDEPLEYVTDGVTPESLYIQNETKRALWTEIAALSPSDRELLPLHYFSGLPLQQVAALVGLSYGAVRQRLSRLRRILRQEMEEQGYDIS